MELIFNYAVLQAAPDMRRGERVNIGIVVFRHDGLDIRVSESRKLSALSQGSWDTAIDAFSHALRKIDDPKLEAPERLETMRVIQNQFSTEIHGWFSARTDSAYEMYLAEIIETLVSKPKAKRRRENSSVVAEISGELRKAEILADRDEGLDTGKVIRSYRVNEELEADFAQMNSQLHIASVLDLRANSPRLAQAALKAVVLDQAEAKHPDVKVHKIGVYAAAPARLEELHHNLAVLRPYADDLVNWDDKQDREGLKRIFYNAYNDHNPPPLLK